MAYWVSGSIIPFDDTLLVRTTIGVVNPTTGGLDTREIDRFRQGTELNTIDKFFVGTQPKFWGGSVSFDGIVSHENKTKTFGQTVSFSDFFGKVQYDDRLIEFDVQKYIADSGNYPFPMLFNNGPQQQEENILEPLTIPFRKNTSEPVQFTAKTIRGSIENGQPNRFNTGTKLLNLFKRFGEPKNTEYFLDEGEEFIGEQLTGSIKQSGYMSLQVSKVAPFTDQENEFFLSELTLEQNSSMSNIISNLNGYNDTQDFIPFNHKSMPAGFDVYGPKQGKYGTDNYSFRNRLRGS